MTERAPGPHDDPEYDWLYGTSGTGVGAGDPPTDPEPTQVLPTRRADRPANADEPTRVFRRPSGRPSTAAGGPGGPGRPSPGSAGASGPRPPGVPARKR